MRVSGGTCHSAGGLGSSAQGHQKQKLWGSSLHLSCIQLFFAFGQTPTLHCAFACSFCPSKAAWQAQQAWQALARQALALARRALALARQALAVARQALALAWQDLARQAMAHCCCCCCC